MLIDRTVSSHNFNLRNCQMRDSNPKPLLMFISTCPLEVQISQGLGSVSQIEQSKTGRSAPPFGGAAFFLKRSVRESVRPFSEQRLKVFLSARLLSYIICRRYCITNILGFWVYMLLDIFMHVVLYRVSTS